MNDYLEYKLLEERAKKKSPGLAAILGFFVPPIGFFYVGKVLAGIVLIFVEIGLIFLSIFGIGIPMTLLWGCLMAYSCYKEAEKVNSRALHQAMLADRQTKAGAAVAAAAAAGAIGGATPRLAPPPTE